jgi:thioredoxin-like negative regulator of GroEL
MPTELTQASFDRTLIQSAWVVVHFCGGWSAPCQRFARVFDVVAQQHPDVVFGEVDTGREQGLETRFDITVVPTVIAFHEAHVMFRWAGPLSDEELEWAISKLLALRRPTYPGK